MGDVTWNVSTFARVLHVAMKRPSAVGVPAGKRSVPVSTENDGRERDKVSATARSIEAVKASERATPDSATGGEKDRLDVPRKDLVNGS